MENRITLRPVDGDVPVDEVRGYLQSRSDVLLDPLGSGIFIITGNEEANDFFEWKRRENPEDFPFAGLITVFPEGIGVLQEFADDEMLRTAREIVEWVLQRRTYTLSNEYGHDLTPVYLSKGLDPLFS